MERRLLISFVSSFHSNIHIKYYIITYAKILILKYNFNIQHLICWNIIWLPKNCLKYRKSMSFGQSIDQVMHSNMDQAKGYDLIWPLYVVEYSGPLKFSENIRLSFILAWAIFGNSNEFRMTIFSLPKNELLGIA